MDWPKGRLLVLCLLGLVGACGGGGTPFVPVEPVPKLTVSGDGSLGEAAIGSEGTERIWRFANVGTATLDIARIDVVGAHALDFGFPDANLPIALAPSEEVQLRLCFHPTATGPRFATVEIASNAEEDPEGRTTIPIAGEGLAFAPPIKFVDVTEAAGIDAVHAGGTRSSGQAWGDVDNDGWLDLFVTDSFGPNKLFMNRGDGTFEKAGQVFAGDQSGGATFADYDNDGWIDLFVCNHIQPSVLYRNDKGTLVDVTVSAGVHSVKNERACAFGDYDADGDLDLYVAAYSRFYSDTLYRNEGDGTFTDVTDLLPVETNGWAFAVSFLDYDNDGDLDIYLLSDQRSTPLPDRLLTQNLLFRNDGAGPEGWVFTEVAESAGAAGWMDAMGVAIGDYDLDGSLDLFISDIGPSLLLRNRGDGSFEDATAAAGTDQETFGWGAVMADFNLDGWPDIYLAASYEDGNIVFRNDGDGTFADVSEGSGADDPGSSYGVAYADYDRDGDVDLVIGNSGAGYRLYRNEANPPPERWVGVRLTGSGPVNRSAIGARVSVHLDDGRVQMQEVKSGSSMGAGNDLGLRFGLGLSSPLKLTITWPDGTLETLDTVPTGVEIQRTHAGPK